MTEYLEIVIDVENDHHEIAIALLGDADYDSFAEEQHQLKAYIDKSLFDENVLKEALSVLPIDGLPGYSVSQLENINWNKKWEENFDPVEINNDIIIRATFHKIEKQYPYEIIIVPKMSFGTGHHATTSSMMRNMQLLDLKGKDVFDAGTGTGVLAIFAEKLGAKKVESCDIDDWCIENAPENFALNNSNNISIKQGVFKNTVSDILYDVILANINKNILLAEMEDYASKLKENAYLVLSGFYEKDLIDIEKAANASGLRRISYLEKNEWVSVIFQK